MSERMRFVPPEERRERPLPKTADFRYPYRGYYDEGGICRVRLFERATVPPVIVVSQLAENKNTSIYVIWNRHAELSRSCRSRACRAGGIMATLRWERYPSVTRLDSARTWLWMQHQLQLAPKTLDAYGRSLNDYLAFCDRAAVDPETASRAHLARYVADLTTRPCPARRGLANATIQLRLTVVRLFYDHLIEDGLREDNPVGRGRYTPGNAFAGKRERGLLARYQRLPWIPGDDQWQALLRAVRDESVRNRAMFVLAYDGALRREELVTVQIGDLDFAHRHVRLRAERTKNGVARVVTFSQTTGALLVAYQRQRATLSRAPGALFLSESRRNRAQPLSASMWSKIVTGVARRAGCPLFTTHTLRHLRLTHMARAGLDLHLIATYAGHRSVQTTLRYIHLSGVELAEKVTRTMAGIDRMVAEALQ